ncbi:MAG: hypothetical protein HN623_01080, partial [Bdellovibrionales bacterium]|nr:hypothetical protein [Bdellovibrionales bacterium]
VDAGVEPATNDRVELAADDSVDLGVDQGDDFATDDNFMSEAVDSGIDLFEGESDQAADFENEFKDSVDSAPDQSVTLDVGTDEGVALDAVVDEGISLDAGADEGLAFDSVAEESGDVESSLVEEEEFNLSSDNEMTDDVLDRMFSSATNRQFEDSTGGRQKWISESVDLPGPKQSEDSTGWISDAPVTAATRREPESMLGGEITNIAELREQRDERESQEQQQEQYNKGPSSPRSVPLVSSENEARELFEGQYRQAEQERARELAQMACRQASEQTQVLADAKARLDAHEQEERLVAEEESRLLALQEIERKSAEIANKSVFDAEVEGEERLLSALVEVRESIDEIEDQGVDLKLVAEEPPVGVVREDFEDISYGSLEGFAHDESIDATRVIPDLDLLTGVRALPEESDAGLDSSLEADSDSSLAQAELFADSLAENKEGGDFELGDLKQSDLGLDERGELQQEQALKEQERLKGQIGEGVEQELDIAMLEAMSSNVSALADDAEPLEISGDTDLATSTDDLMAKTDEDETLQMDVDLSPIEGLEDSVASGDSSQQEFRYDRDKGDDKESSISTAAVRVDSDELFRSSITINNLREEREGLLVELDTARVETREEKRSALGYRAELDEVKIELAILKKRYHSQLDDLQDKLRVEMDRKLIYEEKIKRFDSEVERLNSKLRIDVSQVKKREQELENQLELLQFDTAAQIESRDKKIISLKRHIDAMEFNMETMEIHKQKALAEKEQVSQRLDRVMKTLRGSVDMLEDEVTPLGDDEIIRRMSDR